MSKRPSSRRPSGSPTASTDRGPGRHHPHPTGCARAAATSIVAAGLVLLASSSADAGPRSPTPATVTYDLLVERPLGIVELATGLGITAVAYPVAAISREGDTVVEQCVRVPTRSTFTRTLGRLDVDRRSDCSPVGFGVDMTRLSLGAAFRPLGWVFGGSPFGPARSEDEGIEI